MNWKMRATMDEIRDFIAPYQEAMGVKFAMRWRIKR
jgi:hypothetical protein